MGAWQERWPSLIGPMTTLFSHVRATFVLGLPLAGSHLAQFSIGLTDTIMLGWYGLDELAAIALAASLYFMVFIVGSGFAIAILPLVAAARVNDDTAQVRRVTRMGLWISVLYGIGVYALFRTSGDILLFLGQEPQLAADVQIYLRIAGWAMSFSLMIMVLKSHLAALEHPQVIFWATVLAAILNALLNWLLIFGNAGLPELGMAGAAYASLGTYLLMFSLLVAYTFYAKGVSEYQIFVRLWRPDWMAFGQVFRLGWPIGLTQFAESGLFVATAIMMGWIGALELAAHGIALQIASAMFMVHIGLSSAATVRAGMAWGRQDLAGLRTGAVAALILSGLMVVFTVAMFLGIPETLISLFVDPDDPMRPALIAIGVTFLAVGALFQLADAAQVMALGFLRGVQDTRVPMIYAVASYWCVGIPTSYILGFTFGLGGVGIWLGLVAGLVLAGVFMMARFWRGAARSHATVA